MYWDKVDPEWVEMEKKNPKQLGIGQRKQRRQVVNRPLPKMPDDVLVPWTVTAWGKKLSADCQMESTTYTFHHFKNE